jgi:hypothetical protein
VYPPRTLAECEDLDPNDPRFPGGFAEWPSLWGHYLRRFHECGSLDAVARRLANWLAWKAGRPLEAIQALPLAEVLTMLEEIPADAAPGQCNEPSATPATPVGARQLPPARHSVDFRAVHWYGTDYSFTEAQAAVVAILWGAWDNGTPDVGHRTLLQQACLEGRLVDVFKDKGKYHPALGAMIQSNVTSKGSARLCPPKNHVS